jgi:threonine/homoserine/homoserine lactone efflux protein
LGRSLPHLAGVILGFALMIAVIGLGLDIVFERFPQILPIMRVAGSLYMVWLALKIALAKPIGEVEPGGRRSASSPRPAFSGSIQRPG